MTNRRTFLKTIATAAAAAVPSAKFAGQIPSHPAASDPSFNILRRPDHVSVRFGSKEILPLQYASSAWTLPLLRVTIEPTAAGEGEELPIRVRSEGAGLTHLRIRWVGKTSETLLSLGDAWERSYGDLEWRGIVPERVMPWYFLILDGRRVSGYGVKTQASSFCFWQRDSDGITLWIDLRNGGEAAELAGRDLLACTVVTHMGAVGDDILHSGQAFCRLMCPAPRLPKEAVFGVNDWNYAYGMNTANGILRDADLVATLAPAGAVRPLVVIDDGWQDPARFPSMADLALQIRKRRLRPGLWIRPLRTNAAVPAVWLLPDARFGKNAPHTNLALDPTHPEALDAALETVRTTVAWGYEFIKHDFTTWELLGRWGFAMHGEPTGSGWHLHDRTRTNAEILKDLYRAIRSAAGDKVTILGCNTVGHLAAGIFESQRIGDDTSGHRLGANAALRAQQPFAPYHPASDVYIHRPRLCGHHASSRLARNQSVDGRCGEEWHIVVLLPRPQCDDTGNPVGDAGCVASGIAERLWCAGPPDERNDTCGVAVYFSAPGYEDLRLVWS